MERPREIYAEWLRIIAAFTVVFQHTVTSAWYVVPVDTSAFFQLNFLNSLVRYGVGIFIMISGAFMLSPKYPHTPHKILTRNLPRILMLLVFWVVAYGMIGEFLDGGTTTKDLLRTPILLFTHPQPHLWFLYTLAGLYALTPAMRVFTANASRRMVLYVIALFFTFGLALPTINHLLLKLAHFQLYKNIGIQGCTTFAGFYLTGFYIAHFGIDKMGRRILYGAALISWFIAFYFSTYFSILRDEPNEFFFGNFRPMTFLVAVAIFCFFREKLRDKMTTNRHILNISKCMLGVYLVHPLLIKCFYGLDFSLLDYSPLITAPITAIGIFAIAFIAVYLFRMIPGVKKIL